MQFYVSVPLPGFSGLRHAIVNGVLAQQTSFSPVAGIQWVETHKQRSKPKPRQVSVPLPGFSGLRPSNFRVVLIRSSDVSVPLPGFSGLRLDFDWLLRSNSQVSVPLPGFSGLRPRNTGRAIP